MIIRYLLLSLLSLFCLFLFSSCRDKNSTPTLQADGFTSLEANEMVLSWKKLDETTIAFRLLAPTTGWVGIGFNAKEKMLGSDIIIGSINENTKEKKIGDHTGNTVMSHVPSNMASMALKKEIKSIDSEHTELAITVPISKIGLDQNGHCKILLAFGQSHRITSYHALNRATVEIDFLDSKR